MIRLPNTGTYSLELITAQNGAQSVVSYSDATSSAYTGGTQVASITSATTTTICSTPAASTVRDVDQINIKNTYAGSHTVTVQVDANGTNYPLIVAALLTDESLNYTHGSGWQVKDANGNTKNSALSAMTSAQLAAILTDETGSGAAVFATGPTLVAPILGTPASGTVTNLTGTASININGTVGATTPAAGTFTTLTSTGNAALGDAEATDTHTIKGETTLLANSASAALTVTQTGAGNAFVVEDSASPDSTQFVINGAGAVGIGGATSADKVTITTAVNTGIFLSDGTYSLRMAPSALGGIAHFVTTNHPLIFGTNNAERMRIDSAGSVGIGSAPSAITTLNLAKLMTGGTTAYGMLNQGEIQADVTVQGILNRSYISTKAAAFTCANVYGFQSVQGSIGAGSAITNQYGFSTAATLIGATNNYGFYSDIAAASNRYNFFANGSAQNYFAGATGIGIAPSAGYALYTYKATSSTSASEVASYSLVQASNTSGAVNKIACAGTTQAITGYAGTGSLFGVQGTFQMANAVTVSTGVGVAATCQVVAAGSMTNLIGVQAALSNSGGATIGSGISFYAPAHTVGTSGFGFYSAIAFNAGRWNFYAADAANNAYLGNSSFGKVTAPTSAVDTTSFGTGIVTNTGATYTVLTTDHTIIQTTAASTYTLPAAASFTGRILHLVTQFAGTVISASSNVVPIAGGAAGTAILPATAGKFATLQSNGSSWITIAAN